MKEPTVNEIALVALVGVVVRDKTAAGMGLPSAAQQLAEQAFEIASAFARVRNKYNEAEEAR